jgi:hypothetical protein
VTQLVEDDSDASCLSDGDGGGAGGGSSSCGTSSIPGALCALSDNDVRSTARGAMLTGEAVEYGMKYARMDMKMRA